MKFDSIVQKSASSRVNRVESYRRWRKRFQQIIVKDYDVQKTIAKNDNSNTAVSMNVMSESKPKFALEILINDDNNPSHQYHFETKAINSMKDLLNYEERPYISSLVEKRGDFTPCRANTSSSMQQRSQLLVCQSYVVVHG